ncbi:MAG: DUF1553 domain-containing protein [Rhodopirellula sp.]|nr:DUF1553 domain-containing protein [Rhodopirellula sp.]
MLKTTWVVAAGVLLMAAVSYAAQPRVQERIFETSNQPALDSTIDKIVVQKLASMNIRPTFCSDGVFVRRVYLDVIGTLPTAEEARTFLDDKDVKNKRRLLIDRLLQRDEFADYWSMRWADVLRIKAEFPVNLWPNAARAYHRWVHSSLTANKPYDKFVRELLTSSGSNFRIGQVNFYRAIPSRTPDGIAAAVALTLMGSRIESWPAERREGLAAFFSQVGYKPTAEWKEQVVFWDPFHLSTIPGSVVPGKAALAPAEVTLEQLVAGFGPAEPAVALPSPAPLKAVFPDGKEITIPPDRDPRDVFADWLIRAENPWFAKNLVNRIWAWLLGRGIIEEPDDIRDDNPPVIPELLSYLEEEFVKSGYDMKTIYRLILNSRTYQSSPLRRMKNPKVEEYFGCYIVRRLDAEVLIDAINKVTGTTDLYTSAIPEPFTYIPTSMSAIAIADGSITSPFLALFGRSARATGLANERPTKALAAQWRHLLNSSHIQTKLESGTWMAKLTAGDRTLDEILDELYLTILSRYPTDVEKASIMEYLFLNVADKPGSPGGQPVRGRLPKMSEAQRRDNAIDIAWALINSTEFQFRH